MPAENSAAFPDAEQPSVPPPRPGAPRGTRRARTRAPATGARRSSDSTTPPSRQTGNDTMLVAVRSRIEGATLERVCVIVGGVPYAPKGQFALPPGESSPFIELGALVRGEPGAVYFELSAGAHTLRLITGELFVITPRSVVVVTIGNDTLAHNAPVEVEGAVTRLTRTKTHEYPTIRR